MLYLVGEEDTRDLVFGLWINPRVAMEIGRVRSMIWNGINGQRDKIELISGILIPHLKCPWNSHLITPIKIHIVSILLLQRRGRQGQC